MARMARLGQFLKAAFEPQGNGFGGKAFDLGMTYGPDLAFATLAGLSAPGGPNAMVGGEDLLISLAGSGLSRIGGRLAGQRFFPNNPEAQGRLQMVGDLALTAPLAMFAPRPALNAAIEKSIKDQQEQQLALQEHQQHTSYEQLANALITSGSLALTPGFSSAVI